MCELSNENRTFLTIHYNSIVSSIVRGFYKGLIYHLISIKNIINNINYSRLPENNLCETNGSLIEYCLFICHHIKQFYFSLHTRYNIQ